MVAVTDLGSTNPLYHTSSSYTGSTYSGTGVGTGVGRGVGDGDGEGVAVGAGTVVTEVGRDVVPVGAASPEQEGQTSTAANETTDKPLVNMLLFTLFFATLYSREIVKILFEYYTLSIQIST